MSMCIFKTKAGNWTYDKLPCLSFALTAAVATVLSESAGCSTLLKARLVQLYYTDEKVCVHGDFLCNRSHKWKTSVYIYNTCKHKHKHPTHPPTPHAVSGFHVLFMPKL